MSHTAYFIFPESDPDVVRHYKNRKTHDRQRARTVHNPQSTSLGHPSNSDPMYSPTKQAGIAEEPNSERHIFQASTASPRSTHNGYRQHELLLEARGLREEVRVVLHNRRRRDVYARRRRHRRRDSELPQQRVRERPARRRRRYRRHHGALVGRDAGVGRARVCGAPVCGARVERDPEDCEREHEGLEGEGWWWWSGQRQPGQMQM